MDSLPTSLPVADSINVDPKTVRSFGEEWSRFKQNDLTKNEHARLFSEYFNIFPWEKLPSDGGEGIDVGCGSGRWASLVAPQVKKLHVLDASPDALSVAKKNLSSLSNVLFHQESVGEMSLKDRSLDFAYSLGVLHHVPDTQEAIRSIATKLRKGAPFLIYLYYAFDNRPFWFVGLWKTTDFLRFLISRSPSRLRYLMADTLAALVYYPLAKIARFLEKIGCLSEFFPLNAYRNRSFYTMRTDALDRFGTRLEKRFTRKEITAMLEAAGFEQIHFSTQAPYWVACAIKK